MIPEAQIALQINDVFLGLKEVENKEGDAKRNVGSSSYNPRQTPANLEVAKKHGLAKRVYVNKQHGHSEEEGEEEEIERCICCGLPVEEKDFIPIPLCAELDQIYHLGSGFALYFRFIKYTISMLILVMIVSGIYNLITNSDNQGCADNTLPSEILDVAYCVQGYILSYAIPNKREESDLLLVQAALNLGVVVAIMFFFHYIRYRFRRTEIDADDKTVTPSDYTIAIEGLPLETTNKEILDWVKTFQTEKMPLIVEKIIRPFDINEYLDLTKKYNTLRKHEMEHENPKHHEMSESEKKKAEDNMKRVEQRLKDLKKEGAMKNCPIAYVIFRTAKQANYVRSQFKRKPLLQSLFGMCMAKMVTTYDQINGVRVEVERAPEPTDIQWLNLRYTEKERHVRRFINNTITLILIGLSFGGILLVNWGQNKAVKEFGKGSGVVQGLSIVASVVIVVMNTALTITIGILTESEKHLTTTKYLKGIAQKLAIAQFFNTALTSFFAEMILADQTDEHDNRLEAMNFYGKGGLLEGIFWVFVTQAITGPALTIFDFAYFDKKRRQSNVLKQGDKNTLIQKDANTLFEGPAMNMPAKYAAMIKAILLTTFYAPALPIAVVFTIAGLILSYWADKYTLLKRNALPSSLDDDLADGMIEVLEWAAFTWAAGNLIYMYSLHSVSGHHAFSDTAKILAWIALGLSLFHIFFPMEALNEKLFPISDEVTEEETYDHVKHEFKTDYDMEDPNLRLAALSKVVNRGTTLAKAGDKFFETVKAGLGIAPPGPEDQPVIEEPKVDFRSLDQMADRLDQEAQAASPQKSQRSIVDVLTKGQSRASPRVNQADEVNENEAQPKQEVHEVPQTEAPLQQAEPHDMKSEEQRFIKPQEVQHSQNQVELSVHKETPVHQQYDQYDGKRTPSVHKQSEQFEGKRTPSAHNQSGQYEEKKSQSHMEPINMEAHQYAPGDDSFNIKSDECVETPDASRRVFYVNRSLFSQE